MNDWRRDADAAAVVDELVAAITDRLGSSVVGVYLFGSIVAGGFDASVSDIDLLVVLAEDVDDAQFAQLEELHAVVARNHPGWANRIDAAYLSRAALQTHFDRESPIVVITPGEPLARHRTSPGWATNWYGVREHGVACVGPEARRLIAPISPDDFVDAVRSHVAELPGRVGASPDPAFRAYAVLCGCRALLAERERRQSSKQEAAEWAAQRNPRWRALIESALRVRLVRRSDAEDLGEAVEFLHFVARQIGSQQS